MNFSLESPCRPYLRLLVMHSLGQEIMNQLVEYRHEVLWSSTFRSWKEDLLWSLNPGMIVGKLRRS